MRLTTLSQPLVEAHSFRQTQTAYTALLYHREGINLLQTPLPIFGPRLSPQTWCNSGQAVNGNGHRVILASLE